MMVVKLVMEMRKHAFDSWTGTQKRERQTNFGHMVPWETAQGWWSSMKEDDTDSFNPAYKSLTWWIVQQIAMSNY